MPIEMPEPVAGISPRSAITCRCTRALLCPTIGRYETKVYRPWPGSDQAMEHRRNQQIPSHGRTAGGSRGSWQDHRDRQSLRGFSRSPVDLQHVFQLRVERSPAGDSLSAQHRSEPARRTPSPPRARLRIQGFGPHLPSSRAPPRIDPIGIELQHLVVEALSA